jgi:prepilin peptidase CpaA
VFQHLAILDTIVVVTSALSAFFDARFRRIPNWLIVAGLCCGVLLNAFQGTTHLFQSVAGFAVGVGVLILPFALGWVGAGDVKYFGVIGALLGVSLLPRVFFYSAFTAGVITFCYLGLGLARPTRFKQTWLDIKTTILSVGYVLPDAVHTASKSNRDSVPWGVAFAAGTIIAYYVDPNGRWAGF